MNLPPLIRELNQKLQGYPDRVLTLILYGLAALAVYVGTFGNSVTKAVLAAWFIAP